MSIKCLNIMFSLHIVHYFLDDVFSLFQDCKYPGTRQGTEDGKLNLALVLAHGWDAGQQAIHLPPVTIALIPEPEEGPRPSSAVGGQAENTGQNYICGWSPAETRPTQEVLGGRTVSFNKWGHEISAWGREEQRKGRLFFLVC